MKKLLVGRSRAQWGVRGKALPKVFADEAAS